jgi:hypothetical protein
MSMIAEVREWLEKQGYSLEMRAASAFRAADFDIVRQSSYYIDSETSKAREIDVEVITQSIVGFLDVRFFVECKSGDKPWVLFSSADALMNYNRLFAFCAMSKRARKVCAEFDNPLELFGKFPWMKKDGVGGYSLRQAFSRDIDSAYAAAMNVVKACHNHVKDSTSPYDEKLHFAFPVIVVDKPIIRCTLDASGETELTEVEQGEFLFTGHEVGTCIRVVTIAHLPVFAKEAKQVVEQLEDEVRNEEKKCWML